jgi:hypothetical protein
MSDTLVPSFGLSVEDLYIVVETSMAIIDSCTSGQYVLYIYSLNCSL